MKKSGIRTAALSVAAASALILATTPRAGAVSITVENAETGQNQDVSVDVTLQTMGSEVAGTQNDLVYPPDSEIGVVADNDGNPTCAVNPAINKNGTAFSFQPPNCNDAGTCTGVRALVLSLSNVNPIADGSKLYDCLFSVGASPPNTYEVDTVNNGASDPDGNALETTGVTGIITVQGVDVATIVVGSSTVGPSTEGSFDVSLESDVEVAGTQNDIAFESGAAIQADQDGNPMCAVNPAINKNGTAFSFQPPGCDVGSTCTGIRSLVLSLSNVNPIPDGSKLYDCAVATGAEEGTFPLVCSNEGASDPAGGALQTGCTDGAVTVEQVVSPTDTPPVEVTNTPTATPTEGGNTPTRTRTGIIPPINECDDGCAITAPADANAGWLLVLPAAMLLWLRRRAR
jgi:hypothetical protein